MEVNVMENMVYHAHFDGVQIRLDDPVEFEPNTKLLVTVLPSSDNEQSTWRNFSAQGLDAAYSEDEPEYLLTSIKEFNPTYERG
jgi:hypothetical protein